jgi:hypothetical protein
VTNTEKLLFGGAAAFGVYYFVIRPKVNTGKSTSASVGQQPNKFGNSNDPFQTAWDTIMGSFGSGKPGGATPTHAQQAAGVFSGLGNFFSGAASAVKSLGESFGFGGSNGGSSGARSTDPDLQASSDGGSANDSNTLTGPAGFSPLDVGYFGMGGTSIGNTGFGTDSSGDTVSI